MKRLLFLLLTAMTGAFAVAQEMQMPPIPVDKDVRIGKLDNGLTYYLRQNNWPENRAEFYIAQRVGSIQENDDQRGLAHFLEHMCFNGTEHFPGDAMLRWCETIGVKFGTDINAYTSIDQTVYNISNVPTDRQSALDSCLLILHDWADGLTLAPEEIDKERGVINEEWRLRSTASQRMFERCLPQLYPNCKYGYRMPIGTMEIVNGFKYQTLRDYYEKWYRPDNQCIIVVGNIDLDHTEAEIKRLFASIKLPDNPAQVEAEPVPDTPEPIIVIDKDKEQNYDILELMFKQDAAPDELKASVMYLMQKYAITAAVSMFNDRLAELGQKPDCPYAQAGSDYDNYIFARTKDAFSVSAAIKDGKTEDVLKALLREARRAAEFGFTATEFERFKSDYTAALDKAYSNKDKRYSAQFCNQYKLAYLNHEPIPDIDTYTQLMKQVAQMLPVEAVNETMKQLVLPNDTNLVVLNFNNEKEGRSYATRESLLSAVREARAEKLEAYVDNVKNEPLIATAPKAGKVKAEKKDPKFGYTELTLSNGVKVRLMKTDYKADQVIMTADGEGGTSLFTDPKDLTNLKAVDELVEASGLGNFSNNELKKALAGKVASCSMAMQDRRTLLSGQSTPKDMETMFQLFHLYFTALNKDEQSVASLMQQFEVALKNKGLSPEAAFSDSIQVTNTMHNPRDKQIELADLKDISYDRCLEIARQSLKNAADYQFTIVGNFDEAAIRPLIETYIASLPAQKKLAKSQYLSTPYKGTVKNEFRRKCETPRAISLMNWKAESMPYTLENDVRADIAGQILTMIYLAKIREDAGAAYSVQASGSLNRDHERTTISLIAYCPMKPEKSDMALSIMRDEIQKLATTCDEGMLAKVQEYLIKDHADNIKTNSYWRNVIAQYTKYGTDFHTGYDECVKAQTPASISAFVAELLKEGNHCEVTMLPEE